MPDRISERWLRSILAAGSDTVMYTAVFLSPMDRQRLIKRFGQEHSQAYAHHMTLWHRDDGGDPGLETLPIGKTVDLKIVGYVVDDKGQAVLIQPPTGIRPKHRIPHITISTAIGVVPAYSKMLMETTDKNQARRGFPSLQGRVGWWDGTKERFDIPNL